MKINSLFQLIHENVVDQDERKKYYKMVRAILGVYKAVKGMKNSVLHLFTYQDEVCDLLVEEFPAVNKEINELFAFEDVFDYLCNQGVITDSTAESDWNEDDSDIESDDDDYTVTESDEDDDDEDLTDTEEMSDDDEESENKNNSTISLPREPRMLFVKMVLALNMVMTAGIFYKSWQREFNLMFQI